MEETKCLALITRFAPVCGDIKGAQFIARSIETNHTGVRGQSVARGWQPSGPTRRPQEMS